jgi:hypothetical protein
MTKLNNTEREEFICQAYLNRTHTTTQLQKEFKIYPNEIYKVLKKNNIELRGSSLPKEKALKICEEYKNGKSLKKVCEELSVAESTILKIIKKYKIETRKEAGQFPRKYNLDETILKNIDTFERAQFLGLIYSDGSLSKYSKNISIRLREDDKDYLDDWRINFLKTNKPLGYTYTPKMVGPITGKVYNKTLGTSILDISSINIYKDALKLGLCPNKTKANLPIPNIPEELKIAFLLGLFEGDGTITYSPNNRSRYFSIACQENMGLDIKRYFDSIGLFSSFKKRKYICTVTIARKNDLEKLYNLLYQDASIYMKRKKLKFEEALNAF